MNSITKKYTSTTLPSLDRSGVCEVTSLLGCYVDDGEALVVAFALLGIK